MCLPVWRNESHMYGVVFDGLIQIIKNGTNVPEWN